VDGIPEILIDDRLVLAGVELALVQDLAPIDAVVHHLVERLLGKGRPDLVVCPSAVSSRTMSVVERQRVKSLKMRLDQSGLDFIDHQQSVLHVVPQGQRPAHPHPLGLAGGDLVADALAGDLAFKLREGQQHVEHQPAHRGGGVELLGDGDERHLVALEDFDQPGEVGQAPGQAVDLVDHDDVDLAGLDVGQQALQSGPLEVAAGEAGIDVVVGDGDPPFRALAGHVGQAGSFWASMELKDWSSRSSVETRQ
jgi:hypothetical protein